MQQLIFLLLFLGILSGHCFAETMTIHHQPPKSNLDNYWVEQIKLAFEKTRPTDGDYKLVFTPYLENQEKYGNLLHNTTPNLIVEMSYKSYFTSKGSLNYVPFPADLGILGWRICFVNNAKKSTIAAAKNLNELRQYSITQGLNWSDTKILRKNNFNVIEAKYENLLKIVATGRADLYCRGVNELKSEWDANQNMPNLAYDESFALTYEMPIFYYLHSNNHAAMQRLQRGLEIAWKDGSLKKLWWHHFGEALNFSKIQSRKIYTLENNTNEEPSKKYREYLLTPTSL